MGCSSTRCVRLLARRAPQIQHRWGGPSECVWTTCCSPQDFFDVIDYALKLKKLGGRGEPVVTSDGRTVYYSDDDIDHLGNRRVRAVGEPLENQFRLGLRRMERAIKESRPITDQGGRDAARPDQRQARDRGRVPVPRLQPVPRKFMDQTNLLSEITQPRAPCAPVSKADFLRERAGFEVRDVHPTTWPHLPDRDA